MNWVLDADICPEYHFFRCILQFMNSLTKEIRTAMSFKHRYAF